MKVCLVTPAFFPAMVYGGPIVSMYNTTTELAKLGVEINVSTSSANGKVHLNVDTNTYKKLKNNLFVKYYKDTVIGRFSWSFTKNIKRDIKYNDIVHIQDIFSLYIPVSLYYANKYNKPIIISTRGSFCAWCLSTKKSFLKKIWLKLFINPFVKNAAWHATSIEEKRDILKVYPVAKVCIIPNGINLSDYGKHEKLNKKDFVYKFTNIKKESIDKIIISMGRIHQKKGFDILITSFEKMLADHPNSILLIAGKDDGELNELLKLISKLNLQEHVFFIGQVYGQDKINFYANADLFILTSHDENFGNVYLESLASGTPIIATKNTPWNIVEDYKCGKCVENFPESIYKAINSLFLRDKKVLNYNAIELSKKFTWKRIAHSFSDKYTEIYNEPS